MEKFKKFIKETRFEYKVLGFFIIILLLSVPYNIIKKEFFSDSSTSGISSSNNSPGTGGSGVTGTSLSDMQSTEQPANNQPSSISDAVSADRPLILNDTALHNENFKQMMIEIPEIKHIELATQVENPTVWIYSLNDGLRKDEDAVKYCAVLHNKGIMASSVTIYDEKVRRSGRLVEIGAAKCM